jgi:hypothetical protein
MVRPEDAGQIFIPASHAALPGGQPDTRIPRGIYAVFFSDAGVGMDNAGLRGSPTAMRAGGSVGMPLKAFVRLLAAASAASAS